MARPPERVRGSPIGLLKSGENPVRRGLRGLAALPEANVLVFGFLLHLPWELWLSGSGSAMDGHLREAGELPLALSLAALAHAGIDVLAFWFVAGGARTRGWILREGVYALGIFMVSSLVFTLIAESLFLGYLPDPVHLGAVPSFVGSGLGVPSLLQGLVVPVMLVGMVRRQLQA